MMRAWAEPILATILIGISSLACDGTAVVPEPSLTPALGEADCTAATLRPRPIADAMGATPRVNVFCGRVIIDGQSATDGTRIRLFTSFCGTMDVDPISETQVSGAAFVADTPPSFGTLSTPLPPGCFRDTIFFRVGRRWANETAQRVERAATIRLDLTVTNPPNIPFPQSPTEPIDPRLLIGERECEPPTALHPYVWLSYYEDRRPEAVGKFPIDFVPVPHVRVRIPELDLEGTTGEDGCLELKGFELDEPRLVTIVAAKGGYGSHITRNFILRRDENMSLGTSGEMRRDGIPTVSDVCYFSHPPASAGEMGRVAECRAMGALPPFLARNCEHPGVRRQQAFDPNLRVLVGVVSEADTAVGISGATVEIAEYQLRTVSVDAGCYNFGEFPTTGMEFVTLTVSAQGYDQLTIKNFSLSPLGALDLTLRRGNGATIQDYCRLGMPENQTWIRREVLCRNAGLLQWEEIP